MENGLVPIISGAITCHPDHFALDMIVDTCLDGKRNYMCDEILPYMAVGSENFNCPNARVIENFFQPVLSHKAQQSSETNTQLTVQETQSPR